MSTSISVICGRFGCVGREGTPESGCWLVTWTPAHLSHNVWAGWVAKKNMLAP